MNSTVRTILSLCAVSAVAVCSACSASGTSANSASAMTAAKPPAVSSIPDLQSGADITMPIDAYLPSGQEAATLYDSIDIGVAQCAKGFGITVPVSIISDEPGATDYTRLFGVASLADAQKYGYNDPATATGGAAAGTGGAVTQPDLTPAETTVVVGWPDGHVSGNPDSPPKGLTYNGRTVPTGGCRGAAYRAIGLAPGFNYIQPQLAMNLSDSAFNQSQADSRVLAVFAKWSACMKAQGFSYPNPWTPNDAKWPTPVSSTEIATAVADVQCKQQVNLVGISDAVMTAYENVLIQQNITGLNADKTELDSAAAKAATVVAAGK